MGCDGVVFFEVGLCEAGFAAGVGVSFEGDVEAFAEADAWVYAFFDEVAFALDAEDFVMVFDGDFVAC